MIGRVLSAGTYRYDDFQIGDRFETAEITISEQLIERFADLTGDRFAIHMSDNEAIKLGFPKRVAHGLLILSLIDGLKNQTKIEIKAIASLGWEWTFKSPVICGDIIYASFQVKAKRPTRDIARGIVSFNVEVHNQKKEIVQSGTNNLMVQI